MESVQRLFAAMHGHGRRIALDDGLQTWSYQRLLSETSRWCRLLDGVGAERVAYRLPNGPDWIALDLALLRSGRPALPVPDFFSPSQQGHVMAAAGADAFVTVSGTPAPDGFRQTSSHRDLSVLQTSVAAPPPLHTGTAKVTFTSGTTGTPRGVCLSAAHQLRTARAIESALGGGRISRHLCALPLSLLLENVAGVYANLGNGSHICVPPTSDIGLGGSSSLDVGRFVEAQSDYRPDSVILVPQLLLALTAAAELGMPLPDTYRFVAVGGGKVSPSLLARAAAVGIPVHEGYGLTECGSVVAVNLPGACRPGTVGRPLPHVTVGIIDGEIRIVGSTMLGYLGEAPAGGAIATGDLGNIDEDGFLSVSGRRKHGYVTAFGRNVSPEWIESELTSEIAIGHAVVFGDALPANVALIVGRGNPSGTAITDAVHAANERLPDYARIAGWREISGEDFAASGCLTDNGRPRRDVAAHRYRTTLEEMYQQLERDSDAAVPATGA